MTELGGYLALLGGLGTGLGMILGGIAADRLGRADARWRMLVPMIGALGMGPLMVLQYFVPGAGLSLAAGVLTLLLGHAFYAPVVACAQSLSPANLRALTASFTLMSFNLVGMLGPLVTGVISDYLIETRGMAADSLRYAIASAVVLAPWAAFHYWRAARLLPTELPGETQAG
jgi:MFS family permease